MLRSPCHLTLYGVILGLGACSFKPIPIVARAGTTIVVPLAGEALSGSLVGYGSEVTRARGIHDDQRGELRFVLVDDSRAPAELHPLVTRLVTRVHADPASLAAMAGGIGGAEEWAQILALVDIPATTPSGTYTLEVRRERRLDAAGTQREALPVVPGSGHRLTVLPAELDPVTGSPLERFTPAEGYYGPQPAGNASAELIKLYPWPKLTIRLPAATPPLAARLHVAYPTARVEVLAVFADRGAGRAALVTWRDSDPRGELRIDVVNPLGAAVDLGVAFRPLDALLSGPVEAREFRILRHRLYAANGRVRRDAPMLGEIR